jgi:hypothetical protein
MADPAGGKACECVPLAFHLDELVVVVRGSVLVEISEGFYHGYMRSQGS